VGLVVDLDPDIDAVRLAAGHARSNASQFLSHVPLSQEKSFESIVK
jgi:hypothetical protein